MAEDDDEEEADKEGTGGRPHPPVEEHTKYLRSADCKQSV